ncbi:DivIVA domain-containing protein [Corynebacterium frankenforstense]|uniref:DivIVA domain-containing protein n=1 Tax=Corynebacterium frankenforstense TaxID=1230998 RepID=UPI000952816D|nr:DivIVA domain-containing protein [Corynebacterium frankenforstense]
MLSWIFLIVVLVLLVIVGTWAAGRLLGRGEPEPAADPQEVAAANARAVAAGDLDAVRFELVPRGYRPEQVEAVLDQLAGGEGRGAGRGAARGAERSGDRAAVRQEDPARGAERARLGDGEVREDDRATLSGDRAAGSRPLGWAQERGGNSGSK